VSGDYYDVLPLSQDHLALVAADVSGKGVPGLVVMAMLRTGLRSLASERRKPEETLVLASRLLHGHMGRGMFVTCLYGVLNTRTHRFSYVSAGHCPPLSFGRRGATYLPAGGKPVGMFPEKIFTASLKPRTVELRPGEGLLLYTDGLIEAMNARGEQLGGDAVLQTLQRLASNPRAQVNEALLGLVEKHRDGHTLSDDLTLLSFQRSATTSEEPRVVASVQTDAGTGGGTA
jgi:sigma-B regulation protein RsbU (phosphoserine phosphatase)